MVQVPNIKLNNGLTIPSFGLGTWQGVGSSKEVSHAVRDAIDIGYRYFDCAQLYGNENEVGEAIQEKIRQGIINRDDLFITSKLWGNTRRPDLVEPALRKTLKDLQVDYLDLCLIHTPFSVKQGDEQKPVDPKTGLLIPSDVDYVDTWKAMEEVQKKGLTRSIGISNFNSHQIDRLLKVASIVPVTNQVECHPYLNQNKLRKFCLERGIMLTSYSPLGCPARSTKKPDDIEVLDDTRIKQIGEKYGKSVAQVVLRWNVQLGNSVVPKSSNKQRLKENLDIFDFELSTEDMQFLNSLDCNGRVVTGAPFKHLPHFAFDAEF